MKCDHASSINDGFPRLRWTRRHSCSTEIMVSCSIESNEDNVGNIMLSSALSGWLLSTAKLYQCAFCVTMEPRKSASAWRPAELDEFCMSNASSWGTFSSQGIEWESSLDALEINNCKSYCWYFGAHTLIVEFFYAVFRGALGQPKERPGEAALRDNPGLVCHVGLQ